MIFSVIGGLVGKLLFHKHHRHHYRGHYDGWGKHMGEWKEGAKKNGHKHGRKDWSKFEKGFMDKSKMTEEQFKKYRKHFRHSRRFPRVRGVPLMVGFGILVKNSAGF